MRRLLLVVPALLAALAIAGCADADDDPSVATAGEGGDAGTAELTDEQQVQAFVECLRDQGLDVPDPEPGTGVGGILHDSGIPREELLPALQACQHLAPDGGVVNHLQDPAVQDQLREFAQCMREHGVDVPDPDPNGGFPFGEGVIHPDDPEVQAALEACEEHLTQIRGGTE